MKVLRIYDHLGELKKEFPIYVEGQDFKWLASVPEVIWLGTIALEEASKEAKAEPTPEAEVVEPELEVTGEEEPAALLTEQHLMARDLISPREEVKDEPAHKEVNVITKDEVIGEEIIVSQFDEKETQKAILAKEGKEVKHEPEKVHRKRGRVKRTPSPGNSKSAEVVHQDDSSGDPNQGD